MPLTGNRIAGPLVVAVLALTSSGPLAADEPPTADPLGRAQQAWQAGQYAEVIEAATAALAERPNDPDFYRLRAAALGKLRRHREAVADYDRLLTLDPGDARVFQFRGSEHFKLGELERSLADFDRYLELRPAEAPGHWQRGISLYYLGRYREGREQFEAYQGVDDADVENVVWRFLCQARETSLAEARQAILPVGFDRRVPMAEIYRLFAGQATPDEVLAAVDRDAPAPGERDVRQFYAELYLGLYFEAAGDAAQSLDYLRHAAADHELDHYMWDVARVHVQVRSQP